MPSDGERFQRLHPTSLVFRIFGDLKTTVFPILILYFSRGEAELWYLLFFIPSLIIGIIQFFTVRYRFAEDEIIVKQGIVIRNERHIPFARIQNIDLVQKPLHRLVGVADVRLETASGSEPEAVLKVLSLDAVAEMRRHVFSGRAGGETQDLDGSTEDASEGVPEVAPAPGDSPTPEVTTLLHLPPGELVKLGLISNRGLAVVGGAVGVLWQFDVFDRMEERLKELEWVQPILDSFSSESMVVMGVLGAMVGIALLFLLSVLWTLVRLYDFRLEQVGGDLRIRFGLLTRHAATIPRHRIQYLSVRESVRHRLFGRVSVRVETAGGGRDESAASRQWFLPIVAKDEMARILDRVLPDFHEPEPRWRPLAPRARERMLKRGLLVCIILTGGALAVSWPWGGMMLLALLPLAVFHAVRASRITAYARTPRGVIFRSGVWTRRMSATSCEKIQTVVTHRSPFDRRYGMATLRVDTAGASLASHRISIPFLEEQTAETLQGDLIANAERAGFRW